MLLALEVLQIIAPVIILAGIGFSWAWLGFEYKVQFVTRLTMNLSVPALIFTALIKTEIDPEALRITALAAALAYIGVGGVLALLLRIAGYSLRTFLAPLVFGNTGNLGLPLAFFAFGQAGFDYAVVVFAVMAFLSFTVGVWLVSGHGSPLSALKQPIVWATVLGSVFLTYGWSLPNWSVNTLELLGQIAIPLMLITLGVAITRLKPASLSRAFWLSLLKLSICVAVPVAVGLWLGLPPVAFAALVVQVATPVAVTSYMLAEKYNADADEVAGLVVVSTLLSVLAIPLILAFVL
ncbi:MAG: AEC family transporter [Rhodobacteraceae bacterium]|nr:AEC family transporter [Paracoccaceae bacterium]